MPFDHLAQVVQGCHWPACLAWGVKRNGGREREAKKEVKPFWLKPRASSPPTLWEPCSPLLPLPVLGRALGNICASRLHPEQSSPWASLKRYAPTPCTFCSPLPTRSLLKGVRCCTTRSYSTREATFTSPTRSTVHIPPWYERHLKPNRNAARRPFAWKLPVFSVYLRKMHDFRAFWVQKTRFVL